MNARILMFVAALVAALVVPATRIRAASLDTTLEDEDLGIKVHTPRRWVLHREVGYPSLRAMMVSPDGRASITLAVGQLDPGQSLTQYVRATCATMGKVGVDVQTCGPESMGDRLVPRILARTRESARRRRRIEQWFRTHNGKVLALSLITPDQKVARYSSDLLRVFETMELTEGAVIRPETNVIRGVPTGKRPGSGAAPPAQGPGELEGANLPPGAEMEGEPLPPGGEMEGEPLPPGGEMEGEPLPPGGEMEGEPQD